MATLGQHRYPKEHLTTTLVHAFCLSLSVWLSASIRVARAENSPSRSAWRAQRQQAAVISWKVTMTAYRGCLSSSLNAIVVCIALLALVTSSAASSRCNKPSRRGEHGPCRDLQSPGLKLQQLQLESSASCPSACPAASYHSKSLYCIKDFTKDCSTNVNRNCPPCDIFKAVVGQQCTYHYFAVGGNSSYPHWIITPCAPVSGIEKILDNSKATSTNFLWKQAWDDATLGQNQRPKIAKGQLGLVMNSYYYRSRHQMHIHAARLQHDFVKDCLNTLPATVQSTWSHPTNACDFDMLSKYAGDLSDVNSLIKEGARRLISRYGITKLQVGALVTGNLSKTFNPYHGYIVTVFNGTDHHGDHDILEYTGK